MLRRIAVIVAPFWNFFGSFLRQVGGNRYFSLQEMKYVFKSRPKIRTTLLLYYSLYSSHRQIIESLEYVFLYLRQIISPPIIP